MGRAFAQTFSRLPTPFCLFSMCACWLVAVLAGPFGTYEAMGAPLRVLYWGLIVVGGVVVGFAVRAIGLVVLSTETRWSFVPFASVLLTVIFAPVVIALRSVMAMWSDGLEVYPLSIAVNTLIIALAVFTFRHLLFQAGFGELARRAPPVAAPEPGAAPVPPPEARLLRRLPQDVVGDVLRLSAQNHHVEVVTDQGRTTLRLRLTDAIGEMDPVDGFCVHRSHWVARAAIDRVVRVNAHKTVVQLVNGDEVPVSRKYRGNLVEAGMLDVAEAAE